MATKARVGMIGLSGYGNMVREGLKRCRKLELAAVWSRTPDSLKRSQAELPAKACESYDALLQEPIDGVLIINPNYLHVEYGLKAAEAGKSILIEKPITNTIAEARQLITAFKEKHLLLAVKHLHRFSPASRKIKELVEDGTLGEILSAEAYTSHSSSKHFPPDRWKRDPVKCPAVPLMQLGVHYIDTMISFFGPPSWVESRHRNVLHLSENVDCTVTTIGFGDITATVHAHYVAPGYSRLAVYGSEGVAIDDGKAVLLKREGENDFEKLELDGDDDLVQILDAYGESLLEGKPFEVTGDEAILSVAAIEAAIESASRDGLRVGIDEVMPATSP